MNSAGMVGKGTGRGDVGCADAQQSGRVVAAQDRAAALPSARTRGDRCGSGGDRARGPRSPGTPDRGGPPVAGLFGRDGLYTINLPDGDYLMLAELDDGTTLVAPIDPRRPGVRRYEPNGDLIGEFATLAEALTAASGHLPT